MFATFSGRQLRRIARWGDLIEVQSDQVLAREGHSDWWFFVVVSGRVTLSRDGVSTGELTQGAHFGEAALIGLRPQPLTATATESCVLFVLGPRYVLSLLSSSAGFRRAIAPDVEPKQFADYTHRMHAEGEAEWQAVKTRNAALAAVGARAPAKPSGLNLPQRDRLPGRTLSLAEAAAALGALPAPPSTAAAESSAARRLWWVAPASAAVALAAAALLLYHPPRLVLSAGRPIDVTADITVTGAPTYQPSGHYLMLWVNARQPNLAGYLVARVEGRTVVPLDRVDAVEQRASGREQYLDSQSSAIRLGVAAAGLNSRNVAVHIRDRGFLGPSAGLAYALAIDDLLTPGDLTRGRSIGVTGELDPDGRVAPIGWLLLKAHGAADDHASLLVAPSPQAASADAVLPTCGVTTFRDALHALTNPTSCQPLRSP